MTNLFTYFLIFITAILTIKTDIREKKIYNSHLLLIAILILVNYIIAFMTQKMPPNINYLIINSILSLFVGFTLYFANLWRAGDAKLFFIYSLLIVNKKITPEMPVACIELFFNMFILGFLSLLPSIAVSCVRKRAALLASLSINKIISSIIKAFMVILGLSWPVFPILNLIDIKNNQLITLLIIYFSFRVLYKLFDEIKSKTVSIIVFLTGFTLRFIFFRQSINFYTLLIYLKSIILFTLIYYPIKIFLQTEKDKTSRVPFAPFMFLGSILGYTGFFSYSIRFLATITK